MMQLKRNFRLYFLNQVFTFLLSYIQELVHYVIEDQRYSHLFNRYTLIHGSILVTLFIFVLIDDR
jgi:hypothetical protein